MDEITKRFFTTCIERRKSHWFVSMSNERIDWLCGTLEVIRSEMNTSARTVNAYRFIKYFISDERPVLMVDLYFIYLSSIEGAVYFIDKFVPSFFCFPFDKRNISNPLYEYTRPCL